MGLPQFDSGLTLDARERPDGNVLLRVRDRDDPGLGRMLEVVMGAFHSSLGPPIVLEGANDVARGHDRQYITYVMSGSDRKKARRGRSPGARRYLDVDRDRPSVA